MLGALDELEFKDFAEKLTKVMEERLLTKKPSKKEKKNEDGEESDDEAPKDDELEVDG